jgi:hypothetical protein
MVGSVQDQVLAHDGQANEAKISTGFRLRRSTDIDAGETRTTVSVTFLSIRCAIMNVQGKGVEFDVLMEPRVRLACLREYSEKHWQHMARGSKAIKDGLTLLGPT